MEIFAFFGLINGILALFFGGIVLAKDWRNKRNQIFFLMTLAISAWAFSYWRWLSSFDLKTATMWIKLLAASSMFIPILYFHWVTSVLNIYRKNRYLIRVSYLAVIIVLLFANSSLFIREVGPKLFFPLWPTPGILYTFYFLFIYVGLVTYTVTLLFKRYRTLQGGKRGQVFYILLGSIIGFGGGITNFLLWYDIPIPPYGNVLVALFPFLLAYASLRHRLFNIRVIATELLTFALWIFILIRTLLATNPSEQIIEASLLVLTVVIGVLLIRSVKKEVETREEIEKLARDLERVNERLRELDKLKSEFLSLATHQMRSPLTAIKGYASLILDGSYGKVKGETHEAVERIFQSAESMIAVVEQFLNVSRIEQGRMEYNFAETDVEDLVKDVVGELKPNADERGLELTFSADEGSYHSEVDKDKLKQVFINLIDNGIKYTRDGLVEVSLSKTGGKILFAVNDSGVGMDKEDIDKLFQKFSRAKTANEINVKGTGLGLYLAREIVNAHGGKIWGESKGEGKGSTFYVELKTV